jgi:hypothetical protein
MTGDDRAALATEAFVYGFPLVFDLQQVDRFVRSGIGGVPATPWNRFGHARALAGPETTFVSVNNDTIYSIAQIDLSGGPLRLEVPDTDGRYYVLQFVDAWTDNFAYVGHRATGTEAGAFLLVGPDEQVEATATETVIRFPTTVGSIVGRWAVDGAADLPAVAALQSALTLTALTDRPLAGLPVPVAGVPDDLALFEQLRVWMQAFPPAPSDRVHQERFAPLGLLDVESQYVDPEPGLAEALRDGLAAGRRRLESALKETSSPRRNGWDLTFHIFDYNLDHFEVGALDDPAWKLDVDPATRYLLRAAAARAGLWGNHGYEAAYAMAYVDGDNRPLDGGSRYRLHFDPTPPVGAFWSVTMYDTTDFFLVANPIDRYSIGDRTPGLVSSADGSLTIHLQHDAPEDPDALANWLPTPAGPFRPILRLYEPAAPIFDGSYELPPITRLR